MSGKRAYSSLSGGTGDTNPQFYSTSTPTLQTSYTSTSVTMPPGIGLSTGGRPLAMEILKIFYEVINATLSNPLIPTATYAPGATTATEAQVRIYLTSKNFSSTEPPLSYGDATVLDMLDLKVPIYESTAASTLATALGPFPIVHDLTDGAGHGVLYANQNMFIGGIQTGAGNAIGRIKILYREKYITQAELLGLVLQSNQN